MALRLDLRLLALKCANLRRRQASNGWKTGSIRVSKATEIRGFSGREQGLCIPVLYPSAAPPRRLGSHVPSPETCEPSHVPWHPVSGISFDGMEELLIIWKQGQHQGNTLPPYHYPHFRRFLLMRMWSCDTHRAMSHPFRRMHLYYLLSSDGVCPFADWLLFSLFPRTKIYSLYEKHIAGVIWWQQFPSRHSARTTHDV